ncbi:ABC transporter [Streptomyces sp. MP131-18]|uniref:ABC transporter n=1 Tax=Streptomyces sp. MP131-18 TaxID=1857892 RepID=UPI00097C8DF9|nr:ABC transporter [Streptomyces sp. MP131-18]ONK12352.1 ABC-type transport system involved in multi-copper enzyme maturation, permease component [Streptomyces sp. MP131-18]
MKGALAFEWTKLWTVRSTPWSLFAAALLTAGVAAVVGVSAQASAENGFDTARPAPHTVADALTLGQLAVVVTATLAVTGEYASGSIRTTLHSVPARGRMLIGKAAVVTGVLGAAGLCLSAIGTASAAPLMGETGSFTAADAVGSALGTAAYLAGLALLATGLGTVLRSAAGTITAMIMLLMAVPQLTQIAGIDWLETVGDFLPSAAGVVLMTQDTDPYGTGPAALVLAAWGLAALTGGYVTLRRRDA